MKNAARYILFLVLIGIVAYHSVYFKKLDEVRAGHVTFNAQKFAREFWTSKLTPAYSNAMEAGQLFSLLKTDKKNAFADQGHALGIGNIRYFPIKGRGVVQSVEEDQVVVKLESPSGPLQLNVATEYIFGNAVRDASGMIDINSFGNSLDFNNVSAEINKIIRDEVVPPFEAKVRKGDVVEFTGAIELNQEHTDLNHIEVMPVKLSITH